MSDNIQIVVSAVLNKNTDKELQAQLDTISQKLKLTIANTKIVNQQTEGASSSSEASTKKASQAVEEYERKINKLIHTYKMKLTTDREFLDSMEQLRSKSDFATLSWQKQEQVVSLLEKSEKSYQQVVDSGTNTRKQQQQQSEKITEQFHKQSIAQQKMLDSIRGMRGKDGAFIQGDNLTELNKLEKTIQGFDPTSKNFTKNMRDADLELKKIKTTTSIYKKEVQDADKYTNIFGQSLFEAGKKFAGWLFVGNIIMNVVNAIRHGIATIKELDAEMINLRKVTDATNEEYEKFTKSAIEVGNALGQSTQNVIRATTEWARLGFTMKESLELADRSLMLANVGDMDVEKATQQLISTLHGFNMEAREANVILDQMNEVGNNYAISTEGIGEALRRSSAAMAAGNNTLAETISLLSVANATIQDSEMVGTAFF